MILYDFACAEGHRFEAALRSMNAENPACTCGAATRRTPSRLNIGGRASAGPSRDDMPNSWRGIRGGDPETVRHWHRTMVNRERLEEKYPELAGDRRPVLAHEGAFAGAPLKAGDELSAAVSAATFSSPTPTKEATA